MRICYADHNILKEFSLRWLSLNRASISEEFTQLLFVLAVVENNLLMPPPITPRMLNSSCFTIAVDAMGEATT